MAVPKETAVPLGWVPRQRQALNVVSAGHPGLGRSGGGTADVVEEGAR